MTKRGFLGWWFALLCAAIGAFIWITARAYVQAITIDEADSYRLWVAGGTPWEPNSNNHVLNSLLMLLSTSIAGASHLALRAPALLGAAIYIGSSYWICRQIAGARVLGVALFVCLVYNPFVLDYLVAARGYSLATAFLMCAIAIGASGFRDEMTVVSAMPVCSLYSVCLALSFAANFSFAFADLTTLALLSVWRWSSLSTVERMTKNGFLRILAASVLPGFAISLLLTIPVILHWPKGELTYGSKSLSIMLKSVIESSLYQPNPLVLNPWLYKLAGFLGPILFPALAVAVACRVAIICLHRSAVSAEQAKWLVGLGLVLGGAAILAIGMHRLLYRLFYIPMPMDRTALFLVPMCTLAIGVVAAFSLSSQVAEWSRRALVAIFCVAAVYFLGCLRLSHFKQWPWNADVDRIYSIASYYNHHYGVRDIPTTWMCVSALNFYRERSGHETLLPFRNEAEHFPPGKDVYIVFYPTEQDVIASNQLKVVYRGEVSGIAVAINPSLRNPR